MKRVFLIVLDSVGIGAMPDAAEYGDDYTNTILSASASDYFSMPNMSKLGLFQIDGLKELFGESEKELPHTAIARLAECSKGKDTTIGHWEISGIISKQPLPTFPNGFPDELLMEFEKQTGRRVICNLPYSGTEVIKVYGREHMETGALIVYTSADSVFQIAAHEEIVPIEELYRCCEIARNLCTGDYSVGRVIARPFEGEYPFRRTIRRHDYSLLPPGSTMLNYLADNKHDVLAIGKINDIFSGSGITETVRTKNNEEGILRILEYMDRDFCGLCFTNLVDFDMIYGHRNDVDGYAKALTYFDQQLPFILEKLQKEDILIITADHGCDPATPSTDHSREYTPLILYGYSLRAGVNLHTRESFADIGASILDYFDMNHNLEGVSFLQQILQTKG